MKTLPGEFVCLRIASDPQPSSTHTLTAHHKPRMWQPKEGTMKAGRQKKGQKSQKMCLKIHPPARNSGLKPCQPRRKTTRSPLSSLPSRPGRPVTHSHAWTCVRVSARMCAPCSSVRDWALLSRALLAGWEKPPAAPCVCACTKTWGHSRSIEMICFLHKSSSLEAANQGGTLYCLDRFSASLRKHFKSKWVGETD